MEMPEIQRAPDAVVLPNAAASQTPVQVADLLHLQAAPGTVLSLVLRIMQCLTSALGLTAMISAKDFSTVPAFISFVPITVLQCVWSFSMFVLDLDAIITDMNLTNHWMTPFLVFGDAITAASTFCTTTASSGVVLYIYFDVATCATEHCTLFETAVTRTIICFAMLLPSVAVNWAMSCAAIFPRTPFRADVLLLYSNGSCSILSIIVLFLYYINVNSTRVSAFSFSITAAWIQLSASTLQLAGQLLSMHWVATPVPDTPLLFVFTIILQWSIAFWGLGTACASAAVLHFFIKNGVFTKGVTARAITYCVLSLATGSLSRRLPPHKW